MNNTLLSDVARSNLYTMSIAAELDPRQAIPDHGPIIPTAEVRLLRAQLILEEAMETCRALGVTAYLPDEDVSVEFGDLVLRIDPELQPDLEEIIDGCCDGVYVDVGTLIACGVPDVPHLLEVCHRNDAKFPSGKGILHPTIPGKFGKPAGWLPPNHQAVTLSLPPINLAAAAASIREIHSAKKA